MEIGLSKHGDAHLLTVKGKIRLQNWRVLDKHLESLLAKGCGCLVVDLSDVTLICSIGVGALMHNIGKFRQKGRRLLLFSTSPTILETFRIFANEVSPAENLFQDWDSLEAELKVYGVHLPGLASHFSRPVRSA